MLGYRNAGTANATLVVQRRAAYLIDRTGTTPLNRQTTHYAVSN